MEGAVDRVGDLASLRAMKPSHRRFQAAVAFFGFFAGLGFAADPVSPTSAIAAAPATLFDYDRAAPLDVKEIGTELRDDAAIRDITFVGVKDPIKAYIVTPAAGGRSVAGILYVHWLGERATTNRTEFLNEAVALANQGIVSLLVDTMWAEPKWYEKRVPEEDYDHAIRQVIELRRAMDLLLSQQGVDPRRIAYVGHDFGCMYGVVMGAVDRRASTYVLMAGAPHFIDWFLFSHQPKDLPAYRAQLAPLDPVRFVSQLAPATVFFQFGSKDEYVNGLASAEFYGAASPEKHLATYAAGHDLKNAEATSDRVAWLMRRLAPSR
jgi:dienelactone hydrolase